MYLSVSVYDVGKQETDGDGEAYTYIMSCRNEDTGDSHRWVSSVAVLCGCAFLPMPFPMPDMVIG